MLVLLALTTMGHADPARALARHGEALTERTYWVVEGFDEGPARPKWRNRRGLWRCWTFPDGVAARCIGREKGAARPHIDRRFDAGGSPATSLAMDAEGAWTQVTVHGGPPIQVDVHDHHEATVGLLQFSGPSTASPDPNGQLRWTLPEGGLTIASAKPDTDVFDPAFSEAIRDACACVLEDRASTWIAGIQALRLRIRRPDPDQPTVSEFWAVPTEDRLFIVTFTTPATGSLGEIQARLAHGRAWLALTRPAPEGGTP